MVKNSPANAGGRGSIPGPGRSHRPWNNEARTTNTEPVLGVGDTHFWSPRALAPELRDEKPRREKPELRDCRVAPARGDQRKTRTATRTQHSQRSSRENRRDAVANAGLLFQYLRGLDS